MSSQASASRLKAAASQLQDKRLRPLLVLLTTIAAFDFYSRLIPVSLDEVGPLTIAEVHVRDSSSSRGVLPEESLALFKYLSSFSPDTTGQEMQEGSEVAQAERNALQAQINERLFGEVGFRVLAVFMKENVFAVIERLDKDSQVREVLDVAVGDKVNGYTVSQIEINKLSVVSKMGDQVDMELFASGGGPNNIVENDRVSEFMN